MASSNTAVLQMHQREDFERNVMRGLAAGGGAGVLAYLTAVMGAKLGVPGVPISFLAIAGVALASVRGDKMDKLMLGALSLVLPAAPWLFGFSQSWTVALAGAACGALMVKARQVEKGEEGSVGTVRPGLVHYGAAAGATAGLSVAGLEVAKVLALRMADWQTPHMLQALVSGIVIALFAGIGGIAAHLMLKSDPVEARCEELIPQLHGEFQTLATRALELYRKCGESLQKLPREPAREELARTLQRLTKDAVELAAEWAGVETQLEDETVKELEREVQDLMKSAAQSRDAVAKRQLEMAAASLREEMDRLGELKNKRERILAKLKSQVALLERARVALIGMRSGHTHVKAAEMTALSRKFNALATAQADEAKLAHEVATGVELSAQEAELHAAVKIAESVASAPMMQPVSPVSAPEEQASAAPAPEGMKN